MKYVIVKEPRIGLEIAVLFPEVLQHKDVAAGYPETSVVAAGFFHVDGNTIILASAESVSLGKGPRPGEDEGIIKMAFNLLKPRTPVMCIGCEPNQSSR